MESGTSPGRKVMLVAEPTRESAGALQYAISHVVLEKDELILLHVENPNSWRNAFSFLRRSSLPSSSSSSSSSSSASLNLTIEGGDENFLEAMINVCELAKPKLAIRTEWIEMETKGRERDRAKAILDKSEKLGADIIIIGQRRSLSSALLGYKRSSSGLKFDTPEYLIEKSKCTCVAVQKKGQNAGYVLNSKSHKNFWLLA